MSDADAQAGADAGAGAGAGAGPGRAVLIAAVTIGVLLVGFIILLATSDTERGQIISNNIVGQVAPLVSGPTIDGEQFDLRDHRGQWVLVNMFATWCPGCVAEHPELVEFSRRHEESGVAQVVTIMFGDDPKQVAEFFERNGGDWPVIVDLDTANEFAVNYGVTTVPETYIIGPSGRVEAKVVGASGVTADQLDTALGLADAGDS